MNSVALQMPRTTIAQPCVGLLVSINEEGVPLVSLPNHTDALPVPCRVATALTASALGRSVLLLPDPRDGVPVISGVVQDTVGPWATEPPATAGGQPIVATVDGDELVLRADKRISLHCGKACISLNAEGVVEIRGQYVVSRAARQNRIKGASISFN